MHKSISKLDMDPIVVKLIDSEEGPGWNKVDALKAVEEYRKYLHLCKKHTSSTIVPCKKVDTVWHYHILDTLKYDEDCHRILGKFLHHFPYFGMRGKKDAKNLNEAWSNTVKLYISEFGSPESGFWESKTRCPNCGRRCKNGLDLSNETRPTL